MSSNYMLISNQTAQKLSESAPATFSLFFKGSTAWCVTKVALTALTLFAPLALALTYDIARGIFRSIVPISKKTNNPVKKEGAPKPKPEPKKPTESEDDFATKAKEYVKKTASEWFEKAPMRYKVGAGAVVSSIILSNTIGFERTINWTVKPILEISGSIIGSLGVGILNGIFSTVGDATPAVAGTIITWIPSTSIWLIRNSTWLVYNNLGSFGKIAGTIAGVGLLGASLIASFNVARPAWNYHVATKTPMDLVNNIRQGSCFTKSWSLFALPGLAAQKTFGWFYNQFSLENIHNLVVEKPEAAARKFFKVPDSFDRPLHSARMKVTSYSDSSDEDNGVFSAEPETTVSGGRRRRTTRTRTRQFSNSSQQHAFAGSKSRMAAAPSGFTRQHPKVRLLDEEEDNSVRD